MIGKTLHIFFLLFIATNAEKISDKIILNDLREFLGVSKKDITKWESTLNNNKDMFECIQKTKKKNKKASIDTGFEDCGWEISAIAIECLSSSVRSIKLQLRNVVNPSLTKSTLNANSRSFQSYSIPKDVFITRMKIGMNKFANKKSVAGLSFDLSNGQQGDLSCSNYKKTKTIVLDSLERINGFYAKVKASVLHSLKFYRHRIKPKKKEKRDHNMKSSYYSLLRSAANHSYSTIQDNFIKIGPYGAKAGSMFVDPYLYGHWRVARLLIAFDKGGIKSLQSYMINTFFYYLQMSEIHGNKQPLDEETKVVNVPGDSEIAGVEFLTDRERLIGINFHMSNNTSTGFIGQEYKEDSGMLINRYDIKENQEIMGFFGFATANSIESLGLLVIEKNSKKYYH